MKEASFYKRLEDKTIYCELCPHTCKIPLNGKGICKVRSNKDEVLIAESYGKITSIALDPIEKKPLYHFYLGSKILSIGSYSCNFNCGFCQNHQISMKEAPYEICTPEYLAQISKKYEIKGNIGVAYTYNEPIIGIEFLKDCAKLIIEQGQKNVVVTNGFICEYPLNEILPYIHAMNIDLKSFNQSFYKKIGGNLSDVKRTIEIASKRCHVEVTTLIITGENDSKEEMEELSRWIADIDENIPLHISRFFPNYKYNHINETPRKTIYELVETAKIHLKYVYAGNC